MLIPVKICRLSGPCTDLECTSLFDPKELSIIHDTLRMINSVTNHKEQWYIEVNGQITVPK